MCLAKSSKIYDLTDSTDIDYLMCPFNLVELTAVFKKKYDTNIMLTFHFSTMNHNELTGLPLLGDVSSNITSLSL